MKISFRKIQTKLLLAFLFLILMAGTIGTVAFFYQSSINKYQNYREDLNELRYLMAQIDVLQKDFLILEARSEVFMTSGKSYNITQIEDNIRETQKLLVRLKESPITDEFKLKNEIKDLIELRNKYNRLFELLRRKVRERGFKNFGMEGRMRDYVHFLEKLDVDKELVLQLRRHEKDFFLRKDLGYKNKLHQTAEILKKKILASSLDGKQKSVYLGYISDYEKLFDLIVDIEREIGFDSKKGLRGELNTLYAQINQKLKNCFEIVTFHVERLASRTRVIVTFVLIVMFLVGAALAVYFSFSISRPIIVLDRIAKSVVKGLRHQDDFLDKVNTDDEVGDLAKNFKIMLQKLRASIEEAKQKNQQLEEFIQQEKQRNWENEGFVIFGDILKNNSDDIVKQSYEIITELTKRTGSVQGGLFIVNEDEEVPFLELTAAYAYDRQKFLKKRIEFGEGLIGEAWREEDTKLITDIPPDYAHIKSGTGILKPTTILIVPLKTDNKVEGIIELASIHAYEPYVIEFVEKLSRRIATNIAAVKANAKNIKLLQKADEANRKIEQAEAQLRRKVEDYDQWMQQFEAKLNEVSEESLVFQAVLNHIYDGVVITDEKFSILKVNNYVLKRFSYKRSELEGTPIDGLIDEIDYKKIVDFSDKKSLTGTARQTSRAVVTDAFGKKLIVQLLVGRIEVERKIFYVFLFNELLQKDLAFLQGGADSFLSQN